ncbi:hypothetical protein [Paenibacillus naphthalenovorans]|uniref:hypothetical protein n=1 Tax=Paenibacillus naphthalenovorans TaxID=162209 RepID=UPI003D2E83F4
MNYVIESVRHRDGSVHEREERRKGQRVVFAVCDVGFSMIYVYPDDDNKIVRTSAVEEIDVGSDDVVVTTQNTVYTFRKITEVAE